MNQRISKNSDMVAHLQRLRKAGWDAIIAGGAVRDTFHENKISDVDIFIAENVNHRPKIDNNYNSDKWMEYWSKIFQFNPKKNDEIKLFGDEYTFNGLDTLILGVWEVLKGNTRYQLILLKIDPRKYVCNHFDFGICRAYCDGTKMHFTNEFLVDSLNQTITLYKENLTEPQLQYAVTNHLQKIQQKYPGWAPMLGGVDPSKYKK